MHILSCLNYFKFIAIAVVTVTAGGLSAHAGCKEDIQAMMKAGETAENYKLLVELGMGGQVVQNSEQYYRDYSHFYQIIKQTGVHWLVLGDQEYTSSDGNTWTASQKREADWLEKTLERNAETRAAIKDVSCTTEMLDDKTFTTYRYTQSTTLPVESTSVVTLWVDPETSLPQQRHMKTLVSGQEIETTTRYQWLDALELPTP